MYNALAFALQFPLGVALDARPRLVKGTFVASLALTLLGVGLCACGAGDGALGTTRPTEWMALVTAVSVVGSLSLCFLCRPEQAALWLAFLFVAQLATGPVLSLMHDKSGKASGTAFGLNCLALFTGSL